MQAHCYKWTILFLLSCYTIPGLKAQNTDSSFVADYFSTHISQAWSPQTEDSIRRFEQQLTNKRQQEYYLYHYSRFLMSNGKFSESESIARKGVGLFGKDTRHQGLIKFYNLIASDASYSKDYVRAVHYFNKGIRISEKHHNDRQTAYLNNNIANIFFSLQDYPASYTYASRARELLDAFPDDPYRPLIYAILSVAEAKTGRMDLAREHAGTARKLAEKNDDRISMVVADYAFGDIALSGNKYETAYRYFAASLELSDRIGHVHMSMLDNIGLMNACIGLENYTEAIERGETALSIAGMLNNSNTLYSIHRRLSLAYRAVGKNEQAYVHLRKAFDLYRETTGVEKQKAINDILIKYDTEKKEKEIARQQVLLLEKDVQASRFRQTILILGVYILLLIMLFLFVRYRNRQRLLRQQAENERRLLDTLIRGEEIERARLAGELHDGLASSLTAIRFQLENAELADPEEKMALLTMLGAAHEDTRRISHNLSPLSLERAGLSEALKQFALENSSENCAVHASVSGKSGLSENQALIVYRMVQELVQNARKHAQATLIDVNLSYSPGQVTILVEDNGQGFIPPTDTTTGGLQHLRRRVAELNGNMEIDSTPQAGSVIHIALPVQ